MALHVDGDSILTYGSVELCLNQDYEIGEVLPIDFRLRMQFVNRVEQADGIVILGLVAKEHLPRPACLCLLFSHYVRRFGCEGVDHLATLSDLREPTELIRLRTEQAIRQDLYQRSPLAVLAYQPRVQYL